MHRAATFLGGVFAKVGRDARDARVLDYGCGWGRMIRLLYARVRLSNIFAVDPWPPSAERMAGVHCTFAPVERAPETLPFAGQFDLIYANSVFTHIGQNSQRAVLAALRKQLKPDGLLALTVRQATYWADLKGWPGEEAAAGLLDQHMKQGFAHIPLPPQEGGHDDYGHTSVSLDYIRENWTDWRVDGVQWRAIDNNQTVVYLRPA